MADEGDEVLVDLETLIDWEILPECFPLPIDINDRVGVKEGDKVRAVKEQAPKKLVDIKERAGSWSTDMKFNQISEEDFEKVQDQEVFDHLRKKLLKMYEDLFRGNVKKNSIFKDIVQTGGVEVNPISKN